MKSCRKIFIKFRQNLYNHSLINAITMSSITPSVPKCSGSIVVYKKQNEDSVLQLIFSTATTKTKGRI